MANRYGNSGNSYKRYFSGLQNHCTWNFSHEIKRCLLFGKTVMTNIDKIVKSRDFANKILCSQSCGFSNIHVSMWKLDYKESWALKNQCFLIVVLEKTFFFFYSDQIREFNSDKIQSIFHSQILSAASIISFVAIFCFPQSRIQYRKHNAFPFIFMALFYFIFLNFFHLFSLVGG